MNLNIVNDSHLNSYCIIIWYCFAKMITFIFNKFSLMFRAEIKLYRWHHQLLNALDDTFT